MNDQNDFANLLKSEFELRKLRNPSFSLRAFAKYVGLPVATLKYILDGKRVPSKTTFSQLCLRLDWPPEKCRDVGARLALIRNRRREKPAAAEGAPAPFVDMKDFIRIVVAQCYVATGELKFDGAQSAEFSSILNQLKNIDSRSKLRVAGFKSVARVLVPELTGVNAKKFDEALKKILMRI